MHNFGSTDTHVDYIARKLVSSLCSYMIYLMRKSIYCYEPNVFTNTRYFERFDQHSKPVYSVASVTSSVHGIIQARILEWVAIPFSRDLSDAGIEPSPALLHCGPILYHLSHQGTFFCLSNNNIRLNQITLKQCTRLCSIVLEL